ncbi:hypothetical protein ACFFLM_12270 [Deinococcus oregonensis]|uniref:Uncharacterized protein n=1 Tax=Deinococcus oregonensis TaxID=1805970 RepID=A0ABV6AZ03_9DEIO
MSARTPLAILMTAAALGISPVQALIVPMPGWTPVAGNANEWVDDAGACLLREEKHGQAFPTFKTQDQARSFALKLQSKLSARKVREVVTQPVDRAGAWSILASYSYEESGVTYRISQLYLSDSGILRTVTGSSAEFEGSPCVNAMREFLRYLAD